MFSFVHSSTKGDMGKRDGKVPKYFFVACLLHPLRAKNGRAEAPV